jgi:hypothetical protein
MAESKVETLQTPVTGGCQCGSVRYAMHMTPQKSHYCHCRMCQRATGNLFAALAGAHKDKLEWTRGKPAFFASSTLAQRGFCPSCGTPLTFAYNEAKWIYVTIGSLDDPGLAEPLIHYGVESQVHWLRIDDELPREETAKNEKLAQMTVHQFGGTQSHG